MRKKDSNKLRAQERMNFMRGIDEQMRIRKESSMLISVNQQIPKMNKGKRKEKTVLKSTMKKNP
jgi:hypothetical protein